MKTLIIAVVIFSTAIVQFSCAQSVSSNVVTDSTSVFRSVVSNYIVLKDALTKDQAAEARIAAKSLHEAIGTVPMDKMPAGQHKAWMKYNEKLSYDAEHIKGTDEIDHQREHFISLSTNMYKLLKELDIHTADLYYQYCPMANNNKGAYWISEQSKIVNPYMGKKMLSCGSTKETLKAKQ